MTAEARPSALRRTDQLHLTPANGIRGLKPSNVDCRSAGCRTIGVHSACGGVAVSDRSPHLSSWAAILFAPTLIGTVYGMNFDHMPENCTGGSATPSRLLSWPPSAPAC